MELPSNPNKEKQESPLPSGEGHPSGAEQTAPTPPTTQPPRASIGIGIETEFLLESDPPDNEAGNIIEFAKKVVRGYVQTISDKPELHRPGMHTTLAGTYSGPRYAEWCLTLDTTIIPPNPGHEPYPFENISPILRAFPGSNWRDHVTAMWKYLDDNYIVWENPTCGTHVHISVSWGYSLPALKRLCQAIIHFEPAINALLPPERLRCEYAKSNWIDNPNFGDKNLSREESIAVIEKCSSIKELADLMNPPDDKWYSWNFCNLSDPHGTIEFRSGEASIHVEDVFKWVELAMSFVQAGMELGGSDSLANFTPNLLGLWSFFCKATRMRLDVPGLNDFRYLETFFVDTDPKDAIEPEPHPLQLTPEEREQEELYMARRNELHEGWDKLGIDYS